MMLQRLAVDPLDRLGLSLRRIIARPAQCSRGKPLAPLFVGRKVGNSARKASFEFVHGVNGQLDTALVRDHVRKSAMVWADNGNPLCESFDDHGRGQILETGDNEHMGAPQSA